MAETISSPPGAKLDLAARAAWLYYVTGNTQETIAAKLCVSRQAAQRLISLAKARGLVSFRMDHPVAACAGLGEQLRERFSLDLCDVVPGDPDHPDGIAGLAIMGAEHLQRLLYAKAPAILCLGTGRTLRAAVSHVVPMSQPQHKLVSLIGNTCRDGRASACEVVLRLSERTGAQAYLLSAPVVVDTVEGRDLILAQDFYSGIAAMVAEATTAIVGLGAIAWGCPLHEDGFVNDTELAELIELGAVGEITGYAFDDEGQLVDGGTNSRLTAIALNIQPSQKTIVVAGGARKARALAAALRGGLITNLITDEHAATAILDG